jgi:1-acyl-sn-glycerol-3-phosphate acyltransferase
MNLKDTFLYKLLRPIIKVFVKVVYRPTYIGLENIPRDGAVILAGNHTSILDSILLVSCTKRNIHFLAKKELWQGPKKILFANMGLIPVDRSIHDHASLDTAISYLKNGYVIGIFPEGTTRKNALNLRPFKIGAVKMASVTNTPIVPFVINGKYKIFKKSIKIEFLKQIDIKSVNLTDENTRLYNIINNELEE